MKGSKEKNIQKIYEAMKKNPHQGDSYELFVKDFEKINMHISDNFIETKNEDDNKQLNKTNNREESVKEFKNMKGRYIIQ